MLPWADYTHPQGRLNLASSLLEGDVRPDLGPKSYVAYGRYENCVWSMYLTEVCLLQHISSSVPRQSAMCRQVMKGLQMEFIGLHLGCCVRSYHAQG